jgi:ABC-type antimicrobial peptide transport system permease subunit
VLAVTSVTIGWIALVLSAIGILGRVSQDVVARAREIVIRSALGATPSQIANLFLRDTAKILVLSGLAGTLATFVAFRLVQRQLYGVSGTGLTMYVGVMAILALVVTIATMLPLLRAWRAGESMHLLRE